MLFHHEAGKFPVGEDSDSIIAVAPDIERKSNAGSQSMGSRRQLQKFFKGCFLDMGREKEVLTSVASETKLRQTKDLGPHIARTFSRKPNSSRVALPIEGSLI